MGNLKKYRKLIDQIKTIDLNLQMDSEFYENSEQLVNKTIGELMVLKPEAIARVLRELNEIRAKFLAFYNIKNYWQPENFDFKFYDGVQISVEMYKRFLFDSFTMKWKHPEQVIDLYTMDEIVCIAKYNSTLLAKIRNRIIEPVIENTEKIPQENLMTKYESEFFRIIESISYEFNEDLGLTFDLFNDELFSNINKFKAEINENVTNLNQSDRGFYLKRILERLKKSIGTTILKNKQTGREYPYLQSTFEAIEGVDINKINDLEIFFRLSNDYKNQMVNFISQLIEPITKTTIIGSIGNELNAIRERYRNCGERSEAYVRYYNQSEQPTHVKDILTEKLIPFDNYFGGYSGRLNNPFVYWNGFYIQPYSITYLTDLITERKILYNEKFVTDINEISEYIFAYKEGFELGYEKFDNIEIENKSSVFKSDKLSIDKIINYIEGHKESGNGGFPFHFYTESKNFFWGKTKCVFKQQNGTCSEYKGEQPINICELCDLKVLPVLNEWKSKGMEGGKYYRAWYIMLANYQIFDEYFKSKMGPALNEAGLPQLPENKTDQEKPLTLDKVFESISKYKIIMELLAKNEFIQSNTYFWKDEKRSNKATLISVLKILHSQGFYTENKKLKHSQIKDIALNTFGIEISISHIKQHKLNPVEEAVKLIPIASTLK